MRALLISLCLLSAPALQAAGPLNDTGITFCGSYPGGNTAAPCTPDPAGQDARYGRDAAAAAGLLPKTGGGAAGFDYTKVCMSGELAGAGDCPADPTLGSGPNDWACTQDNVTGLIWEIKTDDGGLRDKDTTYTNYDDPTQPQKFGGGSPYPSQTEIDAATNSIGLVNAVNALVPPLCGAADWRRPTKKELFSLVNFDRTGPAIETNFFPNTSSNKFWSGSRVAGFSYGAWYVSFYDGDAETDYRDEYAYNFLRLVRGGNGNTNTSPTINLTVTSPDGTLKGDPYSLGVDYTLDDLRTLRLDVSASTDQECTVDRLEVVSIQRDDLSTVDNTPIPLYSGGTLVYDKHGGPENVIETLELVITDCEGLSTSTTIKVAWE